MKIAIYADRPESMEPIDQQLDNFLSRRGISAEVLHYEAGQPLLQALEEQRFDLAFFAPADRGGFELARQLRLADVKCELVFVLADSEYMADVFAYRSIGCLIEPVNDREMEAVMERFLFYHGHNSLHYTVHTRDCDRQIPHSMIRYFRSEGHRVLIHMTGGEEPLAHLRRLDDIERELAALPYLRCHQSYLVHACAVRRFEHRRPRLILDDGTEIPVSKRYFNDVVEYLLGRNQI